VVVKYQLLGSANLLLFFLGVVWLIALGVLRAELDGIEIA